MAAAGSAQI